MQVSNEEFFKILVKCCKKIISIKELEICFLDLLPKEMNLKYKEAQKMVEFIKVYLNNNRVLDISLI